MTEIESPSRGEGGGHASGLSQAVAMLFAACPPRSILTWTLVVAALGAAFRIAVFIFAAYSPILDEGRRPVSPLMFQKGADYAFYLQSRDQYAGDFQELVDTVFKSLDFEHIVEQLQHSSEGLYAYVVSGPVFPFILTVFDYGPSNTLGVSVLSLILGIVICAIWVNYLLKQNVPIIWTAVFAILPNAVWYQLNNSADHYLFFFFTLFFAIYFSDMKRRPRLLIATALAVTMCLTKPNALPVLAFLLLDQYRLIASRQGGLLTKALLAGILLLILAAAVFYAGYFAAVMQSTLIFTFYDIPHGDYLTGLFPSLPAIIDMPLSWLTLFGAKLLHFVGLRPTWGYTSIEFVLMRAAPGLVLLPGLIWLILRGDRSVALLVILFMIPPMVGPAQERYNLPIHPILFAYGAMAYMAAFTTLSRRFGGTSAPVGQSASAPQAAAPPSDHGDSASAARLKAS